MVWSLLIYLFHLSMMDWGYQLKHQHIHSYSHTLFDKNIIYRFNQSV